MTLAPLIRSLTVALFFPAISSRGKELLPPRISRPSVGVKTATGDFSRALLRLRKVMVSSASCPAWMGCFSSLRETVTRGTGAASGVEGISGARSGAS